MNKQRILILVFLSTLLLYMTAFKAPSTVAFFEAIISDSSFLQLPAEKKRMPEFARSGLTINDSLQVHLFAWEPMLKNPTNIDVDAKGRVWVCEGYNYRPMHNPGAKMNKTGDRIVILEDTNGDHIADKEKTFFQGSEVNAALGICVLGNKVLISCSPNVFYLIDDDGDDIADRKELLFTGISGEQHDHGMHAFVFGPDGKLYFNYGNAGDQLLDSKGKPLVDKYGNTVAAKGKPFRQGMVFRCNPDGSEIEVLAHNFRNNYEVAVDAFGTMWQSDNDDDGNKAVRINYVMEFGNYGYTDEYTGAGWQATRNNIESDIPSRHWHLNDPGVVPNLLVTGAGSPTGMVVYEGTTLPKGFQNQILHTDAGPKVLRAYPVQSKGAGYNASIKNLVEGIDDWFRPSDVSIIPDGTLMLADWYDPGVGGHQRGDLVKGRLYHVIPKYSKVPAYNVPNLTKPEVAATALSSPNVATRYLAWEILRKQPDGGEKSVAPLLKSSNPRERARAYWFLSKIKDKGETYILKALSDPDDNVVIAGIRMARQYYNNPIPLIATLTKRKSPAINRELAIATRYAPKTSESAALWVAVAQHYTSGDRWYLEALGIGADTQWDAFFTAWKNQLGNDWNTPANRDIIWRSRTPEALTYIQQIMSDPSTSSTDLNRFFRALDFHPASTRKSDILLQLLDVKGPNASQIQKICVNALVPTDIERSAKLKQIVYNRINEIKGTEEYLELAARFKLLDQADEVFNIIQKTDEKPLAELAAKAYYQIREMDGIKDLMKTKSEKELISFWEALVYIENLEIFNYKISLLSDSKISLPVRKAIINSFSWGWDGQDYFMNAIKAGKLPKELEGAAGNLFLNANRLSVREEAAKLIKIPAGANNRNLPTIAELSSKKGSIENGILMYKKYCMGCHVVGSKGINFGPALSEIGSKFGKEGLYMAILMPDAGVSFGYEGYSVKKKDGSGGVGIIVSETEADLELKMMGGLINRYKKTEITEKKMMNNSLMPNLALSMTDEELADLVEYLTTLKKPN